MTRYAMIAIGGAIGALARYLVATLIQRHVPVGFPWGTFVVNVTGCFVMGVVVTVLRDRIVASPNWLFLVPIGFIGAYTTFSTFEMELFNANADGAWLIGGAYLAGSVVVGYVALWMGVMVARVV